MAKHSVNVKINLDGLRNELERALQRTILLASAGLQHVERIEAENLALPTNSVTTTYDSNLKWTSEETRKRYSEWVVTNGFRDSIESVHTFLESAHRVLSVWELLEKQKEGVVITGSEWNKVINIYSSSFHRFGLPGKLDHIKKAHAIDLNEKTTSQIITINKARNCLVHRHGIVSDQDIGVNGKMEVKWTRLQAVLQSEDGEKELVLHTKVEKESILGIKQVDIAKSFERGTSVEFSVKEFSDITWTLFLLGNDLVMKLSQYGLDSGYITEAKNS